MGAVAGLLGVGCGGKAGNLVGTWTESEQNLTVKFQPDGTFTETVKHGPTGFSYNGHYQFSGSQVSLTWDKVAVTGADTVKQRKILDSVQTLVGTTESTNVEFLTPDRINLVRGGQMETFDRVKGS